MKVYIKRTIRKVSRYYRMHTSCMRMLPDFIIIGTQKGGTTFLFELLSIHPHVRPSFRKEIEYFDINFKNGIDWYKSQFPIKKSNIITGESTPHYMSHPHVPKRISEVIPHAKIITILRNPVDRAYSHYQHNVRMKRESLSFKDAIAMESERLQGEVDKMISDEHYNSLNHRHFSYLLKGIYVDQLIAFAKFFDKTQILVLQSEDLFNNTITVYEKVLNFLNLPQWKPIDIRPVHVGGYSEIINATTRKQLSDYFKLHNQRLYNYLGVDFGW